MYSTKLIYHIKQMVIFKIDIRVDSMMQHI